MCQISSRSVYSVTLWRRKKTIFAIFSTSAFSGVTSWLQSEKVEHGCTTTNLPLSNGIKVISVLQCLHGEIGHTNSDVQKRDRQTNKQTNRLNVFGGEIRAPTKLGTVIIGPRARSCTSKSFGGLTHSFAAMGCWKFVDSETQST